MPGWAVGIGAPYGSAQRLEARLLDALELAAQPPILTLLFGGAFVVLVGDVDSLSGPVWRSYISH